MAQLNAADLNARFIEALGDHVVHVGFPHASPLALELAPPLPTRLRAYLFNATNPPGGRPTPEHKVQLMVPGQQRDQRGNFDQSDGHAVLMVGYSDDRDVFVLWDASLHHDFAFSKNAQVRTATIDAAVESGNVTTQTRKLKLGLETVIVAPPPRLFEAIEERFAGAAPPAPGAVPAVAPAAPVGGRVYVAPPRNPPEEPPKVRVFEVDPDLVDRGTSAHKDVQDSLAAAITDQGLEAISPLPGDPQFDVAWKQGGVAYIVEVKSLTADNEERQLRLGLGQVLSYVHLLDWADVHTARAVLAVEREPTADYWTTLCAEHDVILTWPDVYSDLFADPV